MISCLGPWCSHGPPLQLLCFSADGLYWLSDKILNLVVYFLECINESDFKNLCRQTSKSRFCAGLFPLSCFSFQVISRLICFDRLLNIAHEQLLMRSPSLGICNLQPTGWSGRCWPRQELRCVKAGSGCQRGWSTTPHLYSGPQSFSSMFAGGVCCALTPHLSILFGFCKPLARAFCGLLTL